MTSNYNQSEEALISALKTDQGLELRLCRGANYITDFFLEPSGQYVYQIGREPHHPWNYLLHLSSRLFSASSKLGSDPELLRVKTFLRNRGTVELIGQEECPSTTLNWEGYNEGRGTQRTWVSGSKRWFFTYAGQSYVWTHKQKFTGDTMFCHESNGNQVARYTTKMWPRKLRGILTIEPKVQDLNTLHTLVASCFAYMQYVLSRNQLIGRGYS